MTGCLVEAAVLPGGDCPHVPPITSLKPPNAANVLSRRAENLPQTYPQCAAAFQWIYQLANICLHLIIEAKRDVSGVTPGKRYATDDEPPVAADDAAAARFHPISVSVVVILFYCLINLLVTSLPMPGSVFCVRWREVVCVGAGLRVSG